LIASTSGVVEQAGEDPVSRCSGRCAGTFVAVEADPHDRNLRTTVRFCGD
jgi:hypothetical protein